MDVTPEMRRAVYEADCTERGHVLGFDQALSVGHSAAEQVPHVFCRRCDKVWLVIDDPGFGYDDAITKMRGRLKDPDTLSPQKGIAKK